MVMLGEPSLAYAIQQYLVHYHTERNHQGLTNQLISPDPDLGSQTGQVRRCERLDGLLPNRVIILFPSVGNKADRVGPP
jgi:hypothetical protein